MSSLPRLSDLQLSLMEILWRRGEATVVAVHQDLQRERDLALTTVATMLRRLEKRGLLAHRTAGRQFIYRPQVTAGEVRRSMVAELTERLFAGDSTALVAHLLRAGDVGPGDVERVRAMLAEAESATPPAPDGEEPGHAR